MGLDTGRHADLFAGSKAAPLNGCRVYMPLCLSIGLSFYLPIYLSTYVSVYLGMYLCAFLHRSSGGFIYVWFGFRFVRYSCFL